MRSFFKAILFVALLSTHAFVLEPTIGQEGRRFQWGLQQQDSFRLTLTQTSTTKSRVESRETSIVSANTLVMKWQVVEAGDNFKVEQSIESIKLSLGDPAVPAQAVNYDTSVEDQKLSRTSRKLLQQVKPLVGLKFIISMSPAGKILSVELPEETRQAMDQLPGTLELRRLFSEAGLKELLGASAVVFPDKELAKSQSWEHKSESLTAFGKFNRIRTYTYAGETMVNQNRLAEFDVRGEIERLVDESLPANISENGKLKSFQGSGKLTFDLDAGFFPSSWVENRVETERPYREKKILTTVTNRIETKMEKL